MKKIFIMILAVTLLASSSLTACAKDKSQEEAVKKSRKNLTKEELVTHIKGRLDAVDEILDFISELKRGRDPSGTFSYTYNGMRVEELDRETLDKLFLRVQNEGSRIQAERLNKQLENISQAQRAQMAVQQASRVPKVVQPPPQPPRVPSTPPQAQNQISRAPQVPPQPPRR